MDLGPVVCLGGGPAGVCEQFSLWAQSRQEHTAGRSLGGAAEPETIHLLLPPPPAPPG